MKLNIFGRFLKKPEDKKELKEIPSERIKRLSESGISEAEIVNTLKKEGYSFQEIDKAMGSALKIGIEREMPPAAPRSYEESVPPTQQPTPKEEYAPEPFLEPTTEPSQYPPESAGQQDVFAPQISQKEEIEEIVEVVTEEKLADFDTKITGLEEKVNKMNDALQKLSDSLQDIIKQTEKEKNEINAKLEEFSNQVNETIPRINSLEKAFKTNVPTLIDEVKGFAEKIKKQKKAKQKKSTS